MSKIILDFGSGNTCRNDKTYIKRMYDELKAVDRGNHNIVVKWQLFEQAGENIPLTHECFQYAYKYGRSIGYQVTSSIFDKPSLDFLLTFKVPFIKIANNRKLDRLIGEIPRKIPIYLSCGTSEDVASYYAAMQLGEECGEVLLCVSQYPASMEEYEKTFPEYFSTDVYNDSIVDNVSDHTANFDLWYRYQPEIIEWHYKLSDSTGLDAGMFARMPEQLAEIL